MRTNEINILDFIRKGRDKAISLENLASATGLKPRMARQLVREKRLEGYIIASDSSGYYIPSDPVELNGYIRHTEKWAKSILATLKNARRKLKEAPGQESMNGYIQNAEGASGAEALFLDLPTNSALLLLPAKNRLQIVREIIKMHKGEEWQKEECSQDL